MALVSFPDRASSAGRTSRAEGTRRHRRPAGARAPRGHRQGRGRAGHGASDANHRDAGPRRKARRRRLCPRPADERLRSAGAAGGRARDGEDRGLGVLRRRERLRERPLLGQPPGENGHQRDEARQLQHLPERERHPGVRYVLRPPQRILLPDESPRSSPGPGGGGRGTDQQPGLEHRLEREGVGLRSGLDGRDRHPLQVAALPRGSGSDLELQPETFHPLEERGDVPLSGLGLSPLPRHLQVLGSRDPRRDRDSRRLQEPRGQTLRDHVGGDEPEPGPAAAERLRRRRRSRRQVRLDPGTGRPISPTTPTSPRSRKTRSR